jgi:hypothetical protein
MCNNNPNCNNCNSSPCQDCTPIDQNCVTTTTTTCTNEQFTEDCPCGLQSTNCLIYTGNALENCEGDIVVERGTEFNTLLSEMWETAKCNQPVWDGATERVVGVAQAAPYNNINTALVELAKFHFNVPVTIKLEDGTHNLTNEFAVQNFLNDKNTLVLDSVSGIKENIILRTTSTITLNFGNLTVSNMSLQTNSINTLLNIKNSGTSVVLNNVKVLAQTTPNNVFNLSLNASLSLDNCLIEDSDIVNFSKSIFYLDTGSSLKINGGSHSINKKFVESRQSSLKMNNSTITFSNLANIPLIELTSDSRLNLENTRIINLAPANFNSICFSIDQSLLRASYNYSTPTTVISGFYFGIASKSSNVFLASPNTNAIYSIVVLGGISANSSFHIQGGKVNSYDYTKRTIGIDSRSSKIIIENTNMELHNIYTTSFGGNISVFSNTFLFNTVFTNLNPSVNKYLIWEDGGNNSTFYGNNMNLNNSSDGIRTSIQGTQYWLDDPLTPLSLNTITNIPVNAKLIADYSSVIYALNLTSPITRLEQNNSKIY